jgi:hypothetical protein
MASNKSQKTLSGNDNVDFVNNYYSEPSSSYQDDGENRIRTRRSSYLRYDIYDAQVPAKTRKIGNETISLSEHITPLKTVEELNSSQQTKTVKSKKNPEPEKIDSLFNKSGDDIIRKLSTCLTFYGNFVIILDVKKTLGYIEKKMKNVKFIYWHDVMAFVDSYDLPYTKQSKKTLIDILVKKITQSITKRGITIENWRKLMRTLPDDVSSKLDYRLDKLVFDEIYELAKKDQLPFDLSEPFLRLLQSVEKDAANYIRYNSKDFKMELE